MSTPALFLGLDVGASHTRVLADADGHRSTHTGPGADLQRDGAPRTADLLASQIQEFLADVQSDIRLGGICLGVAGARHFEDQQLLRAELRQRLGALSRVPLAIEADAAIALEAAFGGGSGAMVAVNAGVVAHGRTDDGDLLHVGGWGPLLGDQGGGHALGLAALRSVAASMDGGPPSLIAILLAERHGILTPTDLLDHPHQERWAIEDLAPLVVEAAEKGDWVATSILKQQANALAKQIGWLAARAGDAITPRLSLVGRWSEPGYYRECIAEALLRHLPRWRIARPQAGPVEGALRLARRLDPQRLNSEATSSVLPTEEYPAESSRRR